MHATAISPTPSWPSMPPESDFSPGVADVRERAELRETIEAGIADLSHIDIIVANAGIMAKASGTRRLRISSTPATTTSLVS